MVSYNSQNIVEAQPSVNREFLEEMRYIDWSYSEDVVDYILESEVDLTFLDCICETF